MAPPLGVCLAKCIEWVLLKSVVLHIAMVLAMDSLVTRLWLQQPPNATAVEAQSRDSTAANNLTPIVVEVNDPTSVKVQDNDKASQPRQQDDRNEQQRVSFQLLKECSPRIEEIVSSLKTQASSSPTRSNRFSQQEPDREDAITHTTAKEQQDSDN